jgi:hypothetical protein
MRYGRRPGMHAGKAEGADSGLPDQAGGMSRDSFVDPAGQAANPNVKVPKRTPQCQQTAG